MSYLLGYSCFAGFLIAAFAASFVIARNPRSNLNRSFLITASASAVYNLGVGIYIMGSDPYKSLPVHQMSVTCWLVFLAAQLYFSIVLAERDKHFFDRLLLGAATFIAVGLAAVDWSGTYIYQVPVASYWGLRSFPGPYYYFFTIFSIIVAGLQFTYFGVAWTKTKNMREKKQVVTVMIGLAAGSSFGVFFDIIAPLGGFFTQSFGWMASTVYVSSFAYAMVRYGMLAVTPSTIAGDVINTMPDLLVVIGLDRRISLVNQQVVSQLGSPAPELIGNTLEGLIAAPDAGALSEQLITELEGSGTLKELSIQLRCRDGKTFPVRLNASIARDQFGNELGKVLVFHDVSEEQGLLEKQEAMISELTKTKERMLSIMEDTTAARDEIKKLYEDLKMTDKMKTEFLSVISHELRTPLTPIRGYLDLIISGQLGSVTDGQKNALGIIYKENLHLQTLIDSILDVSRLERGMEVVLQKSPILLKKLLSDIIEAMKPEYEARGIKLELNLPPDLPTIIGDESKLHRLITNILGNALKFTPRSGLVKIGGRREAEQVRLEIEDNGIGIAAENIPKIFNKFYQVDSTYTRAAGGVGLGLAICKEIVEAHGGKIWAESAGLGWGTKLTFTLPVA
jgi:PAS domain S-box-containing protein